MIDIKQATQDYEDWLGRRIPLISADITLKHQRMAESVFPFLRATFYRWVQQWPEVCPDLASTPAVLSVGDLHVENFGTWRDVEGRLIWGINDFDEAWPMPYTNDLVRLATSARLAIQEEKLSITPQDACDAILEGYRDGTAGDGGAIVLAEQHHALREMAIHRLRDPQIFWDKFDKMATLDGDVPHEATDAIERWLPEPGIPYRVVHRIAGLGSLGRQRFVALGDWRGGKIAREAKALVASACLYRNADLPSEDILYEKILATAVRARDPWVQLAGRWIVRRLSPDCSRIELSSLPDNRDELKLLRAMGQETANVHLGDKQAKAAIAEDLTKRNSKWLRKSATAMADAVEQDFQVWRVSVKSG